MKLIVNGQEVEPAKKVKLYQYMAERDIIALMRRLQTWRDGGLWLNARGQEE